MFKILSYSDSFFSCELYNTKNSKIITMITATMIVIVLFCDAVIMFVFLLRVK